MIGHSLPELVFIRTCILGLRLIAPLSIAHVAASLWRGHWIVSRWLGYYAIVEAVFYLCVYMPRSRHLQKVSSRFEPRGISTARSPRNTTITRTVRVPCGPMRAPRVVMDDQL